MRVLRSLAALVVIAGTGVACADKAGEVAQHRVRVAVGSERDATADVRIPGLGLALKAPAEGWKLMEASEARALADGAVLGAVGPHSVAAALIVTPVAETQVDVYAKAQLTRLLGEVPNLASVEVHDTTGLGYAASEGAIRRAGTIWLKGGLAYELRVWGINERVDAAVTPLLSSMSFFEREGPIPTVAARDQRGADWRVSGGNYENGASGLRVAPTKGLRLVVGASLAGRDPQADVILSSVTAPMELTVASEPVTSAAARASRKEALGSELGGEADKALQVEVLGQKLQLEQRRVGAELVAFGDVCDEQWCHALMARYAPAAGKSPLLAALASLGALAVDRRKALLDELAGAPRFRCSVSDGHALRGRTYRSFEHDVTFTSPGPEWELYAGEDARRRVEAASLFIEARRWGISGALVVDEKAGGDAEVHHAAVVDALTQRGRFQAKGKSKKVKDSLVSSGAGGLGLSYVVATLVVGDKGVQLVLWGTSDAVSQHEKEILAVVGGLSSSVEKAVETPPGGYLDRRLGISAAMPVGWRLEVETPAELAEHGAFVTWEKDGRLVALTAMCLPRGGMADWSSRYLDQRLRERLGPYVRGAETSQKQPVAGRDAVHTAWHATLENVDVVVFRRGNAVFSVATADHNAVALDKALESLAFVD